MCTYCLRQDGSIPTYEEWLDMIEILEQLAQEEAEAAFEADVQEYADLFGLDED